MSVRNHLEKLCSVSPFFKLEDPPSLQETLAASRKRLVVFDRHMVNLGYPSRLQPFSFRGYEACNGFYGAFGKSAIWLLVHHDYKAGTGADDNAAAMAVLMEAATRVPEDLRDSIVFASFDLEEIGLGGSLYFRDDPSSWFNKALMIAAIGLDCIGSGPDLVFVRRYSGGRRHSKLSSHPSLVAFLISLEPNVPVVDLRRGFWSDQVRFASIGVPTAYITSLDVERYIVRHEKKTGCTAHTNRDIIENINIERLERVTNILLRLLPFLKPS